MTKRVLSILGQDSFLRGGIPCKVSVKHGVQFAGYGNESASSRGMGDYDMIVDRSVATIEKLHNPKAGDRLVHPDGDYVLDTLHHDNGVAVQFVVRKYVA